MAELNSKEVEGNIIEIFKEGFLLGFKSGYVCLKENLAEQIKDLHSHLNDCEFHESFCSEVSNKILSSMDIKVKCCNDKNN